MVTFVQRVLLIGLAAVLCNCSLVLEDPRPYPEQKADSSIVIEIADAGLGTMNQALSRAPVLVFSVGTNITSITPISKRPVSTLDSLCESSLPDFDDFCWFFQFVID